LPKIKEGNNQIQITWQAVVFHKTNSYSDEKGTMHAPEYI